LRSSALSAQGRRATLSETWGGVFELDPASLADDDARHSLRATANFAVAIWATGLRRLRRAYGAGLDAFGVMLLLEGAATGRAGARRFECRAGDIVIVDLVETLEMEVGAEGLSGVTLWAPRSRMLAAVSQEEALHGLTLTAATPAGALVRNSLESLAVQAADASADELDLLADGVLALLGKVIAPLLNNGAAPSLASYVSIRRYIDRNLRSPELSVERIVETFGLSRAALYRLFTPVGGVASYIRDARLQRAYKEIVDAEFADRRIGPIAYGLGFKNLSAFNRLFRDAFGLSPRAARAGRATEAASPAPAPFEGQAGGLHALLLRLGRPPVSGE
jgi:AraC-like DNA-binding protein